MTFGWTVSVSQNSYYLQIGYNLFEYVNWYIKNSRSPVPGPVARHSFLYRIATSVVIYQDYTGF